MSDTEYSDTCSDSFTESCPTSTSSESRRRRVRQLTTQTTQSSQQTIQPGIYSSLPVGAIQIPNFAYPQQAVQATAPSQSGLSLSVPLNPISNLQGLWSQSDNAIKLFVQRRGGVVTMQWETFSGLIGAEGLKYIVMHVSFPGMPITPITESILVEYRGVIRHGFIRIDPYVKEVIQFHFDMTGNVLSSIRDKIVIYGKAISWIARDAVRTY